MENMSSFRSYGKINELAEFQAKVEARRRTRKRIAIIVLSSIVLVAVVLAAVFGTSASKDDSKNDTRSNKPLATSIKAVCGVTLYPDSCYTNLGPLINSSILHPDQISKLSIQVAINELSRAGTYILEHAIVNSTDNATVKALMNCQELFDLALDHLNETLGSSQLTLLQAIDDLQTWISSAGTYQQTCIDGIEELNNGILKDLISGYLKNSTELTSNGLAIITWLSEISGSLKVRRLMSLRGRYRDPEWVHPGVRKILESDLRKQADIVVAKDGSGKYKTISAAVEAVPEKSKKRFVIYVKKGIYVENVRVEKKKWNVVMVGDGMNSTIVSGRLNFVDGTPTFSTATFAAKGKGFIARDMGFQNTAGSSKHQAVAMMSTSDQSIFYRCQMNAFQDTLYTHSNRQFYRECNIYGTVDFIFGNSAVVFQNCNIMPRLPMRGQKNTITAQGRFDPNQNTGISIQDSIIKPFENLGIRETYLGRPWKNYSTTVFIDNNFGSLINPSGWLPWVGTSAPDTIFYAEYQNYGPGSSMAKRVKWKGLKRITSSQTKKFTVSSFIKGTKWISNANVPHTPGL